MDALVQSYEQLAALPSREALSDECNQRYRRWS